MGEGVPRRVTGPPLGHVMGLDPGSISECVTCPTSTGRQAREGVTVDVIGKIWETAPGTSICC